MILHKSEYELMYLFSRGVFFSFYQLVITAPYRPRCTTLVYRSRLVLVATLGFIPNSIVVQFLA